MNRWISEATVAVALACACFSLAQAAEDTNDALLTCAKETDDARRLRCFDTVVADLRRAPAATAAARPSAPVASPPAASAPVAAPAISREEKFGARGNLDPARREALSEINGKVTEVGTLAHGEFVVTLDNGQVWVAKTATSKVKVKVGDAVTIEAGALGSYTLIANGRSSKVSRVR